MSNGVLADDEAVCLVRKILGLSDPVSASAYKGHPDTRIRAASELAVARQTDFDQYVSAASQHQGSCAVDIALRLLSENELQRLAERTTNPALGAEAVRMLSNSPNHLRRIAASRALPEVVIEVLRVSEDPSLWRLWVRRHESLDVRRAAFDLLAPTLAGSEDCLRVMRQLSEDTVLLEYCVQHISNEACLAEIAGGTDFPMGIRCMAFERLTDPNEVLRASNFTRFHAFGVQALARIAVNSVPTVRHREGLWFLLTSHDAVEVREAALESLGQCRRGEESRLLSTMRREVDLDLQARAVEYFLDEPQLVSIAIDARLGWPARSAALYRLSDERGIYHVAKASPDQQIRQAALDLITGESFLAGLAATSPDLAIRKRAMERLTDMLDDLDRDPLWVVAARHPEPMVQWAAIARLGKVNGDREEGYLLQIMYREADANRQALGVANFSRRQEFRRLVTDPRLATPTRLEALRRLTDPLDLLEVAMRNPDLALAQGALDRITTDCLDSYDRFGLWFVACEHEAADVRSAALARFPAPAEFRDAVLHGLTARLRIDLDAASLVEVAAVEPRSGLWYLLLSHESIDVRLAALDRLTADGALRPVRAASDEAEPDPRVSARAAEAAWCSPDSSLRRNAASLVAPRLASRIAFSDPDSGVRAAAVARIDEPLQLYELASSDHDELVREKSMALLTDQDLLARLALAESVSERMAARAVGRVSDQDLLGLIAWLTPSQTIRWTAEHRILDKRAYSVLRSRSANWSVKDLNSGILGAAAAVRTANPDLQKAALLHKDPLIREFAIRNPNVSQALRAKCDLLNRITPPPECAACANCADCQGCRGCYGCSGCGDCTGCKWCDECGKRPAAHEFAGRLIAAATVPCRHRVNRMVEGSVGQSLRDGKPVAVQSILDALSAVNCAFHPLSDPMADVESLLDELALRASEGLAHPTPRTTSLIEQLQHDARAFDASALPSHMRLHAWQQEALDSWVAHGRRGIVEAVTGSGKTWLGMAAVLEAIAEGRLAVIVVPRRVLQDQWVAELEPVVHAMGQRVHRLGNGYRANPSQGVLVAVVNSLAQAASDVPRADLAGGAALVVADECHNYGSDSFSRALSERYRYRLGLTATLDGAPVTEYYAGTVFELSHRRALREGAISPYEALIVRTPLDRAEQLAYDHAHRRLKLAEGELLRRVPELARLAGRYGPMSSAIQRIAATQSHPSQVMAAQWKEALDDRTAVLANSKGKAKGLAAVVPAITNSRGTLVFTMMRENAKAAADLLEERGLAVECIDGESNQDFRYEVLDRLQSGKLQAVVAPRILDEGVNVPRVDTAVVVATSQRRRQMVQRLGRIVRRKEHPDATALLVVLAARGTPEDPESPEAERSLLHEVMENAEVLQIAEVEDVDTIAAFLDARHD